MCIAWRENVQTACKWQMYDGSMFPCIYSNISYVWHLEHEILLKWTFKAFQLKMCIAWRENVQTACKWQMYDGSMFPCIYDKISSVWHLEHEILLKWTF